MSGQNLVGKKSQASSGGGDLSTSMLSPDSHRSGTILSVQILRFVAAFAVTLYHAHGAVMIAAGAPKEVAYQGIWHLGASGVHIFFVISGFVMVLTSFKGDRAIAPSTFLRRRFLRIYPIYWVLALIYILAHALIGSAYELTGVQYAGALALVSTHAALIIGPGWTLAYEVYFYLCFAVSLMIGSIRALFALTVFFLCSVVAGMMFSGIADAFPLATNGLLLEFILGCWLGYGFLGRPQWIARVGWPGLLIGTAALLLSGLYDALRIPTVLAWGIPSFLIVAGALSLEHRLKGRLARAVALLGDSSYFLYLSHILLIDLMTQLSGIASGLNMVAIGFLSLVSALLCVAVSHLGHLGIEVPLLKLLQNRSKPHPSRVEQVGAP
jgi:exopolysaccharide production protein ExoZ